MTPKLFAGLTVAAGISAAIAATLYGSESKWSSGAISGKQFLPNLNHQATNTAFIKIRQGEKTLTFKKDGNAWKIQERGGYPVKPEHIRALILQLSQSRLVDAKTNQPSKHTILELENPSIKEAKSKQVQLLDKNKKPLADIVVGKKRWDAFGSGKSGMYVRKTGENQTWLASMDINADLDIKTWVEEEFFSFKISDIKAVEIAYPNEEILHVMPKDDKSGQFMFSNLPEGKTLKNDANATTIARAFESLSLEDVKKLQNSRDSGATATATVLGEGFKINFNLQNQGNDHWLSIQADAESGSSDESKKIVTDLNKKFGGWSYKIPKTKAESLFKRWSDLIETG